MNSLLWNTIKFSWFLFFVIWLAPLSSIFLLSYCLVQDSQSRGSLPLLLVKEYSIQNSYQAYHIALLKKTPSRGFSSGFKSSRASLPCVFRLQPTEVQIKHLWCLFLFLLSLHFEPIQCQMCILWNWTTVRSIFIGIFSKQHTWLCFSEIRQGHHQLSPEKSNLNQERHTP